MKNIFKVIATLLLLVNFSSCNESLLDEVPLDFLSPENAYISPAQFDLAVSELHRTVRAIYHPTDGAMFFALFHGTDQAYNAESLNTGSFADYSLITSGYWWFQWYYREYYLLIAKSNTIIAKANGKYAKFATEDEKNLVIAQARFFRGYAYRCLAHLYGGVPKIDYEVEKPIKNFTRASREEIYALCRDDFDFAAKKLPSKAAGKGELIVGVANHFLSEIYICLKDYDKAIEAASQLINDPQYGLMTERFGARISREGDVFWDLFRKGNVNRADGNKETLWAMQFEYNVAGGNATDVAWMGYNGERGWGPRYWTLKDPDGKAGTIECDSLGRGASWVRPTYYAHTQVFADDWNDMRNSKYNMKRDFYYNQPNSAYFGKKIEKLYNEADTLMAFYPYVMKVTDWPHDGNFAQAQVFRDVALARLAETYLLRAEAYLGKGDKSKAAADINVVRDRAHAKRVAPDKVDIDYILDERTRELLSEEYRQITLCRLGKLYERTLKYNPIAGKTVKPKNNLWAIPQAEIDLNTDAVINNNDGF